MQTKSQFQKNKMETKYHFSCQVRALREEAGLSIKELAQESHIFEKHLQEIEMGRLHNFGAIFALAQFFDKKVEINLL